jgi:FKBP-type peptidyl-prolyl cis-trans isomerase
MKQFFLVVGASAIALCAGAQGKKGMKAKAITDTAKKAMAPAPAYLKSNLDSFSYALGMNIANNLKQQSIDKINGVAMQKAMDDIFKKKTPALDEQQANSVIQKTLQGNSSKKSNSEKQKCTQFLATNKKRAGVISLPSGLQYEVLTKGDQSSATPKLQDTVVAHYAGTLIDGKEFDNSYKRGEPLTIPVGGVIKGWTEILQLMHIGDKFKVYIPSELGYGDRGAGADIPGGAALIFDMELLGIKPAVPKADAPVLAPVEDKVEEKKN